MQLSSCHQCSKPTSPGNLFCAYCGAHIAVNSPIETVFFDAGIVRNEANLQVRLADGQKVGEYRLNTSEFTCGRGDCDMQFDDPAVSLKHARFYYRDGGLYVRDLESVNGIYIRLRERIPLSDGDHFMFGRQIFTLRHLPRQLADYSVDGTRFSGSPIRHSSSFQITRILTNGSPGDSYLINGQSLTIGRSGCNINYPHDGFMSQYHGRLIETQTACFLEDAGSTNGTYFRVREEVGLKEGDALVIGQQIITVHIT